MLPYSREALLALLEQYNHAIWPAQAVALVLALACVGLALRPAPGAGRAVCAVLAVMWLWTAGAWHAAQLASLNFAAPVFAGLFALEAILLVFAGVLRGRLAFRARPDLAGWVGLAIAVVAIAVYPLLGRLEGHTLAQLPAVGVTPAPTALLTIALLMLADGRAPGHLLVVPVLWCLTDASSAYLLGLPGDVTLVAAALAALLVAAWKHRRVRRERDIATTPAPEREERR